MRFVPLVGLVCFAAAAAAQPNVTLYPGQSGAPLLNSIDAGYSPGGTLGYNPARDSLYAYEQRTDGQLCGVYTRFCITLTPGADPSTDAFHQGVNAEHTWPQSMGAADEPARSDMHALFPAKANVNSSRSNHPYGEIPDAQADGWYRDAASQSAIPTAILDEWSEKDNDHPNPAYTGRFEPRHDHKGNAARAVFYFRAVYPEQVASYGSQAFFDVQAPDLIVWHYSDPVDLEEFARSEWIASMQGTHNPFVLDSTLARRAYNLSGTGGGGGTPPPPPPPPPPSGSTGPLWVNELHYDNASTDTGEGVELAGPAGTSLSGWSIALYNGNGGTVYATVALSGTLADQQGGFGTVWVPIAGLQNGSPDGLALVAPDGTVAQFLSYEGVLAATAGPAAGTSSSDIGVAETSSTPSGWSLQLVGAGSAAADFAWQAPEAASPGAPNAGQTLGNGRTPVAAWINEVHYDDGGSDQNEGIEVAGTAGLDLGGWSVALYNGSNGTVYDTIALSGAIDDEGAGFGALWFSRAGIQNGSPDGFALVDDSGAVVQFLSYEGVLTATAGPAAGTTSEDIGVSESGSGGKNDSIQLVGTGTAAADFSWSANVRHTRGSKNRGQTFGAAGAFTATADAPGRGRAAALDVVLYPNPARDRTTLALSLTEATDVRADVFDTLGRLVTTVEAGRLGTGFQSLALDLAGAPAGVYVVRVALDGRVVTRPLTVVR
ncbi:endonuclease [Rubrivirga sp. IMCC45206]|uniref:endonuclease n=1 Tax=Rubrivirga sp. IMCC45206 TaxID=3391614 RepID=UPI003990249C